MCVCYCYYYHYAININFILLLFNSNMLYANDGNSLLKLKQWNY